MVLFQVFRAHVVCVCVCVCVSVYVCVRCVCVRDNIVYIHPSIATNSLDFKFCSVSHWIYDIVIFMAFKILLFQIVTYAGLSMTSCCSVGTLRGSRIVSTESSSLPSSLERGVALCCGEDLCCGLGGGGGGKRAGSPVQSISVSLVCGVCRFGFVQLQREPLALILRSCYLGIGVRGGGSNTFL